MTSRRVSPVLVGRDAELETLATLFDEAAGGTSGTALIGAEAGGGKSRLVTEFTARVRSRALVLTGGCVDLGPVGLPYAPFIAALRELVRERGAADVTALLPGNSPGELARLVPELGIPAASGDPEMARGRLFVLLLTLLEELAARRPLVLTIEDVHWADRSTAELLVFLVRNLRKVPVLVVVTFRSEDVDHIPELRRLVAELGRMDGVIHFDLPRLSRDQVAAQLQGMLGHPAEPAVANAVYQRGGGNPLFTEALLSPGGEVTRLPWTLRELLLSRVKELPEEAQQVLRVAAVGGTRVGHRLLTAATGLGDPALDDLLRPAVAAGVLVAGADEYAFRHELFREALLDDVLPGERARAHRAFAEALEPGPPMLGAASLGTTYPFSVQRALHWRGAGEDVRALHAAWVAAAEARAALAYAEQLKMLEQVLELWVKVLDAASHTGADHVAVAEQAAEAAWVSGEPARGLKHAEAALSEATGERRASLLLLRSLLRREQLLPGQVDDLHEALHLAVSAPDRLRGEILVQLFWGLVLQGRVIEARQVARDVRALVAHLTDPDFRAEALIILASLESDQTSGTGAALREALEAALRSGSGRAEVRAHLAITDALERQGQHEQAIQAGQQAYDRSRQLALTQSEGALIAQKLAESLTSVGRWDEALRIVEETLARSPAPAWRSLLLLVRWQIAVARGDLDTVAQAREEVRILSARAEAETQRLLMTSRLEIESLLAEGDLTGALATASAVPPSGTSHDPRYLWPLLATAMHAWAEATAGGTPEKAGAVAGVRDALNQSAAGTPKPGPVERAHAADFAAEAARADGNPNPASCDAAAASWEAIGQPYPLACALLRGADAAARHGHRDAAAYRLLRAAQLAGRLGARPLQQEITRLARRARIDLPADTDGPAHHAAPFGLTHREAEVLRLVAAGRTNKQIAAELYISPKTASVHVSNILGKLGVTSRVEAAATAHRLHRAD